MGVQAGSAITGLSVFLNVIAASYVTITLFVIILAFGEALWSPRLYEYTATIAPEGREGTYMALATVPTFAATVATGGMSGWLLGLYCPCFKSACEPCCTQELPDGVSPCAGGRILWTIIGSMVCMRMCAPLMGFPDWVRCFQTISSAVLLVLFRPIIEERPSKLSATRLSNLSFTIVASRVCAFDG